jgi:CDP-glucose 4,6-dehydratase
MPFYNVYQGRRVLVTGHTGFKGAWLSEWLMMLGAHVTGLSLAPPTRPALFVQLEHEQRLDHRFGDICDFELTRRTIEDVQPEFVFHLAAQSLVRRSYIQPVETYATNVLGTVHVLEAIRMAGCACAAVAITSDKCYENREWEYAYRENDHLGGHDPYSSSKGAAEIVIAAYRQSFFSSPVSNVSLASARAGNVIGGGDWAADRIVPDCIRALKDGEPIAVRNKASVRPWQHVLEPLSGYLTLAAAMGLAARAGDTTRLATLCSSYNFGPASNSQRPVQDLVVEILKHWTGTWSDGNDLAAHHEARLLRLAIDKASSHLHWHPVWPFEETVERTVNWYRRTNAGAKPAEATRDDILAFTSAAVARRSAWAC